MTSAAAASGLPRLQDDSYPNTESNLQEVADWVMAGAQGQFKGAAAPQVGAGGSTPPALGGGAGGIDAPYEIPA